MEITFKNCEALQTPVFILSMAQALKDYQLGNVSKKELLEFYGEYFVADNTKSSIAFDTDFSIEVKYQIEKSFWQIDLYPANEPTITFKDLTPKAPCTCCGK